MTDTQLQLRDELRRLLTGKPFAPFTIVTNDGRRFEIVRQFQAAVGEQIVLIAPPKGNGHKVVRIDQIQSLAA